MPKKRRDRKRRDKDENCCVGCVDDCASYCAICGPAAALTALLTFLRAPTVAPGDDPAAPRPQGRAAALMYGAVRRYRVAVSPRRPACCPYTPSCSTYAVKALHQHGALRGGLLTLGRLTRCRPAAALHRGLHDPVPERHH
ncbi:membrane protein insertion efficiency factor YidD [Streptomyces marianii]|uniref:membrane protein insertion efficiency factor YidD n=1 Tax=Streptomyces marianii TaxID=1817406 RepID=UPI0018F8BF32|nr:membrane protein insertion efficiency factor YidD [Streptomyces marianii]